MLIEQDFSVFPLHCWHPVLAAQRRLVRRTAGDNSSYVTKTRVPALIRRPDMDLVLGKQLHYAFLCAHMNACHEHAEERYDSVQGIGLKYHHEDDYPQKV